MSKQISNLNAQVVLLTSEVKAKECSCGNDDGNNDQEEIDAECKNKMKFNFPIKNFEIFINFNETIQTDPKYRSTIVSSLFIITL